jgi:hypothetical protein
MDERLRFVARLLEGEKMAPLCAEFGIKNPDCSQMAGRHEMFERCQPARRTRSRGLSPVLALRG